MRFIKFVLTADKSVKNFCGTAKLSVLGLVAVLFAIVAVGRHFSDDLSRHFQSVPDFEVVGEEIAILAFRVPSLRVITGVKVEPHIMSAHERTVIAFNTITKCLADFVKVSHHARTVLNVLNIAGNLVGIVCGLHQVALVAENVSIHKGISLINISLGINDRPAKVVGKNI